MPITILKSKLRPFNPFWNANVTNEDRRQIAPESRKKIAPFNSVNSEITGWMLTKFVPTVARILPFNILKADLRSANPLSNARATSKGRFWRCLQTHPKFSWLP